MTPNRVEAPQKKIFAFTKTTVSKELEIRTNFFVNRSLKTPLHDNQRQVCYFVLFYVFFQLLLLNKLEFDDREL